MINKISKPKAAPQWMPREFDDLLRRMLSTSPKSHQTKKKKKTGK